MPPLTLAMLRVIRVALNEVGINRQASDIADGLRALSDAIMWADKQIEQAEHSAQPAAQ